MKRFLLKKKVKIEGVGSTSLESVGDMVNVGQ